MTVIVPASPSPTSETIYESSANVPHTALNPHASGRRLVDQIPLLRIRLR